MMKRIKAEKVKFSFIGMAAVALMSAGLVAVNRTQSARARDYNAEIKALQNQINEYNQKSSELAAQSSTLQGKIDELQNQQNSIQAQINLTTAQQAQLSQQISDTETKIKSEAQALSKILQAQYYSSQTSALDVLMNSESVSDYVDRQTRQQSISDQTQSKVAEIKQLKRDLQTQKDKVDKLKEQQQAQKQDLANSQAEQQKLLDDTQGQEAKFQELTKNNNDKIAQLKKEQAEEIARRLAASAGRSGGRTSYINRGGSCGGGYPASLCNARQDSLVDPWGMYNRECVSYVAYKVASTYGWPSYWTRGGNNAKQWPAKARAYGIPTSSTPKAGAAAVMYNGYYGHIAWVEAVNGNQVTISDYNLRNDGTYSRYVTSASTFDVYIYFDQMP